MTPSVENPTSKSNLIGEDGLGGPSTHSKKSIGGGVGSGAAVTGSVMAVESSVAAVGGSGPAIAGSEIGVGASKATVGGSGPAIAGSGMAVGGSGPTIAGSGMAVGGSGPTIAGSGMAVGASKMTVGGSGPAIGGSGPAIAGLESQSRSHSSPTRTSPDNLTSTNSKLLGKSRSPSPLRGPASVRSFAGEGSIYSRYEEEEDEELDYDSAAEAPRTICNLLEELTGLIDTEDLPVLELVQDKIIEFAQAVSEGGPEMRAEAVGCQAYQILCQAWSVCCFSGILGVPSPGPEVSQLRDAVLRAFYTLTAGHPDIIDAVGWQIITLALDKSNPEEAHILALRVMRNVCMHSEVNREELAWNYSLIDPMTSLILRDTPTSDLVQEWCATAKVICLGDDPRERLNRVSERKRAIYTTKVLPFIAGLLSNPEYEKDEGALNAMIIFLGTMAVNQDVCIQIERGNVLPALYLILKGHIQNKTLIRNGISLLRYLNCEPDVREKANSYQFMRVVLDALFYYKHEADVVDVALSCCAIMTLENGCQVSQFIYRKGLALTYEVMKEFRDDMTILKGALFTLRNVCENGGPDAKLLIRDSSGYLTFLSELLLTAPDLKEFYLMPVLREFTDVILTEEESSDKSAADQTTISDPTASIAPPLEGPPLEGPPLEVPPAPSVTGEAVPTVPSSGVAPSAAAPPPSSTTPGEGGQSSLPVGHPEEDPAGSVFGEAAEANL